MENKLERLRNGDIFEDLINAWKRLVGLSTTTQQRLPNH